MNIQKVIEELGYKRKEAQLYLAALLFGEARVSELAAKLKIPRSSAIVIAEKLHKDGLLNYYEKHAHKYWVAENPEKLLLKLKREEATLQSILPELKAMQPNSIGPKPTVKTYVGANDIKQILDDIILTKTHFKGIIAWSDWMHLFGKEYVEDWIEMQTSHFLRVRFLTPHSEAADELKRSDGKYMRETRFLSAHTSSLNTATFMYGNKVAVISLNDQLPTGFLIEDKDVHNTMCIFFEELWNKCE